MATKASTLECPSADGRDLQAQRQVPFWRFAHHVRLVTKPLACSPSLWMQWRAVSLLVNVPLSPGPSHSVRGNPCISSTMWFPWASLAVLKLSGAHRAWGATLLTRRPLVLPLYGACATAVESSRPSLKAKGQALVADLLRRQEVQDRSESSFRVGISGPPGVGKSTLIEALGTSIIDRGHRLAVLVSDSEGLATGRARPRHHWLIPTPALSLAPLLRTADHRPIVLSVRWLHFGRQDSHGGVDVQQGRLYSTLAQCGHSWYEPESSAPRDPGATGHHQQ